MLPDRSSEVELDDIKLWVIRGAKMMRFQLILMILRILALVESEAKGAPPLAFPPSLLSRPEFQEDMAR